MKLDQTFTVQADPDEVWKALTDVMRVAPNLPGAAITEDAGDGVFKGEFKVKIGPTTAAYHGALKMEHLDEDHRVATMSARGTDKRGNGGATATIVSSVEDAGGGTTRVDVATDFAITGKLARFGRGGMIQDVSNRLLREFAANLQEDLAGSGGTPNPAVAEAVAPSGAAFAADQAPPSPEAAAGTPAEAVTGDAPPPPRPPRPPAEPVGGLGLMAGVAKDRLAAAAGPLVAGFVLGVLAARTLEIRRR
jgi:uncharacterized protein